MMRLLHLCAWLFTITEIRATTLRKRLLRETIDLGGERGDKNAGRFFSSFFDEYAATSERELEDLSMSMSMPTAPNSPTTSPPTSTPSPTTSASAREEEVLEKCGVTTLERSRDILSVLSFVSEEDALVTFGTPQYKAREWLEETDSAIICADNTARVAQRYRAAVLYYSLGGTGWTTSTGWLEGSNECEWYGLTCADYDASGLSDTFFPITSVSLNGNNLEGDLPVEIFGLVELLELFMQKNDISGSITQDIINLSKLQKLDLDSNKLSGPLPLNLYQLSQLDTIDLNNNLLEGSIPNDIGNLENLLLLQLEDNNFSGVVPADGLLKLEKLGKSDKKRAFLYVSDFCKKKTNLLSICCFA